jgi:hypothetical protein
MKLRRARHARSVLEDPTERDEIPEAVCPLLTRTHVRTTALSRQEAERFGIGVKRFLAGKKNLVCNSCGIEARR